MAGQARSSGLGVLSSLAAKVSAESDEQTQIAEQEVIDAIAASGS